MYAATSRPNVKLGGTDFKWGGRAPLPPPLATTLLIGVHLHILRDAIEKRAQGFMMPSEMTSLTQLFYDRTLPSFSFAERTCVAIFFFRWPTEHVTSKLLYRSKSMNYCTKKESKTS